MDTNETITEVLINEHGRMREMLARFIREIERDEENILESFQLFKKKEKRHVFIEENKIFNLYKDLEKPLVKKLILQHVEMAKIVAEIENKAKNNGDAVEPALNLQEKLREHTHLEEKDFYPVLDKNIPSKEKNNFLEMIKQEFEK